MLVGGVKKSTMEGIQLRGDINVCLQLGTWFNGGLMVV